MLIRATPPGSATLARMRFGEYLADALARKGVSQGVFAKRMKTHQQNISAVISGKRTPPLEHLDDWAAFLAEVVDREQFLELAWLEHSHPQVRRLLEATRGEVVRLREKVERYRI